MTLTWPNKDTDEVLDYELDWSARLGTDTISTSTWTIPSGLTGSNASHTNTTTITWLADGVDGSAYEILNRITTAGGRTMDQTVKIKIKQK